MEFTCDVGDGHTRWLRGMAKAATHFAPIREDLYIYIIGSIMRYVAIEHMPGGRTRVEVLRTFNHGFDGVDALEADPGKEVYAIAERSMNPRIQICHIEKKKDEWNHKVVANLTGIQATEIRAMRFNKKEIIVILTGYPTFSLSIWKWTTEQELMVALSNEPSEFSDLLISPLNDCHWVEYGRQHMTFYDLQSFTKNDVVRTQISLPQRFITYEKPDPAFGQPLAMSIVSACFTNFGDFYVLDNQLGLHILNQDDKVLTWLCSIGYGFLGTTITRIVPFGDCIAEVHNDGWILAYDIVDESLKVKRSFKLTSGIQKYFQFPGSPDSFHAITEKEGFIEWVDEGALMQPFVIPDFLFSNVRSVVFIEPRADYCAVLADSGKVAILDSETGDIIDYWKLPFRVASLQCHPILPFMFCGTVYGCVNVLDIQNLKRPKLVTRIFLTKEKDSCFSRMAMACQGRYLITADSTNDRVYLLYGYPFEEFEYLDSVRVPGDIRCLNVPGCGAEDGRLQVMVYAKDKVEELCPSYIYNYSMANERLNLVSAQAIENPVMAVCFSPMKQFLYTYHVDKKQLGITPFCDDNTYPGLQEPELMIQTPFEMDVNKVIVQGDKLYTFGEDGTVSVFETPIMPTDIIANLTENTFNTYEGEELGEFEDEDEAEEEEGEEEEHEEEMQMVQRKKSTTLELTLVLSVQTHSFLERGVADGVVSLDGSQIIAIGFDGTFTRIRIMEKPDEPNWAVLGYLKPRLYDYQMATYQYDQSQLKQGKKPRTRLEMIRILADDKAPRSSIEDEELKALIRAQQYESNHLDPYRKRRRRRHKGHSSGESEPDDDADCDEWSGEGLDGDEHHCLHWSSSPHDIDLGQHPETVVKTEVKRKRRSDIRRELEEEAARLRKESRPKDGLDDDAAENVTKEDMRILLRPKDGSEGKNSLLSNPDEHREARGSRKKKTSHRRRHHHHTQRDANKRNKKFRDIKSKYSFPKKTLDGLDSSGGTEEAEESQSFASLASTSHDTITLEDETEDEETEDGSHISGASSLVGNFRRSKLGKLTKMSKVVDDGDFLLEERFKRGTDFFQATESVNLVQFSGPRKVKGRMLAMSEGVDLDGTYCVNYKIQHDEIPAPEFWSKFESTLQLRQFQPRTAKLQNVLDKMMELFAIVMKLNKSRETRFQLPIEEFNLDDDIEALLQEKGSNYAKYCHIQMMARNKLRNDRIEMFKDMLWNCYVEKGKLFLGYASPIVVTNYPLKSHEATFGKDVQQCQEERRLELRIESMEDELADLGNHYAMTIVKSEMDDDEPDSRMSYMKSMMSMDMMNEDEDEDEDDSLLHEWGAGRPKKESRVQPKAPPTSAIGLRRTDHCPCHQIPNPAIAFGTRLPSNKPRRLRTSETPRVHVESKHRKKKKSIRVRPPTAAKLRIQQRQRKLEATQTTAPMDWRGRGDGDNLDKKRLLHIGFDINDYPSSAEEEGDEDYEDDGGESIASSHVRSKQDFLETIKPSKRYMFAHGVFGPRGARVRRRTTVDIILGASVARKKRKKQKKVKNSSARRNKNRKGKPVTDFVILSEEESDGEEGQEQEFGEWGGEEREGEGHGEGHGEGRGRGQWEGINQDEEAFIELKNAKFATMPEEMLTPYYNVERIFGGNLRHELEDMYQYRGNPYQYHQMELKARHQFVRQIWLILDEIYRLKLFFDELFKEAANYKLEVLDRMKHRNERIREIYYYLNLDLDIIDDVSNPKEDPGLLFVVNKEEIPVVRYYTAEQLEQQKLEAEEAERAKEEEDAIRLFELEEEEEADYDRDEELAMLADMEAKIIAAQQEEAAKEEEQEEEEEEEGEGSEEEATGEEGSEEAGYGEEEGEGRDEEEEHCGEWRGEGSEGSEEVCGSEEEDEEEEEEEEEEEVNPLEYLLLPGEKLEDLILKHIPKPDFMLEKGMMEYTLEEFIAAREYRDECEVLEKHREKLKRHLRHELHALYKMNANDYNSVDMRLKELFMAKVQFHYNILMEESTIMRLIRLMRTTDDCQLEEDRINVLLSKLQEEMKSTQLLVAQLTIRKNECKEKEMIIIDRESDLERTFRKDLGDVGHYLAFFIKNYKRKPKIHGHGVDRTEVYEMGIHALKSPNLRAFGRDNGNAARAVVSALMDLEDPMLMPTGCPRTYWDKFCKLRRKRLICDFETKFVALELDNITKGLQECSGREDVTAKSMASVLAILSHRTEMRNYLLYNTEFQYITGKGNVEINYWSLTAHENAVMTMADNVDRLNTRVSISTDHFLRDTKRCIFIHRDVRDIEWRFKAMHRTRKDLKQLLHDLNNTRPNKELLRALSNGLDLAVVHQERVERVKELLETADKHQEAYLASKNKLKEMYGQQIKSQTIINQKLKKWLATENRVTSLLKHSNVTDTPEKRAGKYHERVSKFLAKGYMIRRIHDNYQTINFLEGELSRYYQKSFPCL